jgi:uncharacterized membrane protein YvbJ
MKKRRIIWGCLKNKRFRQKTMKGWVENRSDQNKKSIIVFCVITIVVMIVMNLCTAIKPLFNNSAESHSDKLEEVITEPMPELLPMIIIE